MKTYSERTSDILKKVEHKKITHKKTTRSIIGGACALCLFLVATLLFIPYDKTPPELKKYASSEYYRVIEKIGTFEEQKYKNAFEQYVLGTFENLASGGVKTEIENDFIPPQALVIGSAGSTTDGAEGIETAPVQDAEDITVEEFEGNGEAAGNGESASNGESVSTDENYVETTDNQVTGVVESDIIKRSDKYIYYLRGRELSVYSIDKENSKLIGSYEIADESGYKMQIYGTCEMFLSQDCKTITLIDYAYDTEMDTDVVALVALDVSQPENKITEKNRTYLTGEYVSARMVGNEFLVMSKDSVSSKKLDFSEPETFIPQYGTADEMVCVAADKIICPDSEVDWACYTVVCRIDSTTLDAIDTAAFLGYTEQVYVSEENIFATKEYYESDTSEDGVTCGKTMTEITAMNYGGEEFSVLGSVSVEGTVKDQYSLDEYHNEEENKHLLRVVTTTEKESYKEIKEEYRDVIGYSVEDYQRTTNAALYCVDLNTWQIVASVMDFAPENETVESVRFDGNYAYVCTAEVVYLTDPVYFFDMTNLNDIVVKDTGTIEGYSTSLVNFGEYLLGIGFGSTNDCLKVELYQETEQGVESVATYEVRECSFSRDYKSYLVDRENMRLGLGVCYMDKVENLSHYVNGYVLLQFDGTDFVELVKEEIGGDNSDKRAVIIDEYIYIFGDEFVVQKL